MDKVDRNSSQKGKKSPQKPFKLDPFADEKPTCSTKVRSNLENIDNPKNSTQSSGLPKNKRKQNCPKIYVVLRTQTEEDSYNSCQETCKTPLEIQKEKVVKSTEIKDSLLEAEEKEDGKQFPEFISEGMKMMPEAAINTSNSEDSPQDSRKANIIQKFTTNENGMVVLGPNGTMLSLKALSAINWSLSGAAVTRKILVKVFGRETLASNTISGKPSPAFSHLNKPKKGKLDPLKIADIIQFAMERTGLSKKDVKSAIVTKCADEGKRQRQEKAKTRKGINY